MDLILKEKNVFYHVLCILITENEKFFDRSDAKLYWRTVLHFFSIYHHYFIGVFAMGLDLDSVYYYEVELLKKYRLAYLTGWNFTFQTVFLTLSFIHDLLEWTNKNGSSFGRKIAYWRDIIFQSMVVPYTLFVTSMFWCVYLIDRELVFPKVFDEIVPWWFNHCVHTNVAVVLVIETLLQPRRYPTNKKLELSINTAIAVGYAVVYYSIFFFTGHWLYKVFGVMTWWQVCLYQLLIWASNYIFYIIQFPINRFIHGSEDENDNADTTVNEIREMNGTNNAKETRELDKEISIINGVEVNGNKNGAQRLVNVTSMTTDLQIPPFSTKSWSVKYRTLRSQFENTKL